MCLVEERCLKKELKKKDRLKSKSGYTTSVASSIHPLLLSSPYLATAVLSAWASPVLLALEVKAIGSVFYISRSFELALHVSIATPGPDYSPNV